MNNAIDPQLLEAAATWHVDLLMAPDCARTRQAHQQWLQQDIHHRQAWARMEALQGRLGGIPPQLAQASLSAAGRQRRRAIKTLSLLLVGTTLGSAVTYSQLPWQSWLADRRTARGERRQLTLADGTRVEMNTDTALDIRYGPEARTLVLYRGEILVETASAVHRTPFSVITPQGRILALGTRFLVRHTREQQTLVSVLEDAVELYPVSAPRSRYRLEAGHQQLLYSQRVAPSTPLPPAPDAWRDGMLVVDDWRLDTFIQELSRYHGGFLSCAESVAGLRISGGFSLEDPRLILDNLAATLPIRVRSFTPLWTRLEPALLSR